MNTASAPADTAAPADGLMLDDLLGETIPLALDLPLAAGSAPGAGSPPVADAHAAPMVLAVVTPATAAPPLWTRIEPEVHGSSRATCCWRMRPAGELELRGREAEIAAAAASFCEPGHPPLSWPVAAPAAPAHPSAPTTVAAVLRQFSVACPPASTLRLKLRAVGERETAEPVRG